MSLGVVAHQTVPGQLLWVSLEQHSYESLWDGSPWGQKSGRITQVGTAARGDACLVVSHDVEKYSPYLWVVCRGRCGWFRSTYLSEASP